MAKSIMIQGTASGVGKTVITMALCRIFLQDGYRVAPFKSQNITSSTAIIQGDLEIAVSQLLQAKAAGVEPDINMNPVVLKPLGDKKGTQIILNGKPYDTADLYNFKEIKRHLIKKIMKSYEFLADRYDIIVIEGAGSPAELNLNKDDIVNMGIARRTSSPVILVADIDRGGVFASLYGTLKLLEEDQSYIKATLINRFKGNISYFDEGVRIIEDKTGISVVGVVPYVQFDIPEEDELYGNKKDSLNSPHDTDDNQFDLIAGNVRKSVNMELIYKILNDGI